MTRVNRPKKAASPVLTQAQLEIAVEGEQEINSQKRGAKTQKLLMRTINRGRRLQAASRSLGAPGDGA